MADTSHLVSLLGLLSAEKGRLAAAKGQEAELRAAWVRQLQKEVNGEERFLGMTETDWTEAEMSDEELMAELMA